MVIAFLAVGAYVVSRNLGGGGRPVTIDLTVHSSTMTPDTPTANQGDKVTMTISADRKEEIHLHGYDIPFQIPSAGGKVTHTFTADKSGSFPIEIEDTGTPLGQFQVNP